VSRNGNEMTLGPRQKALLAAVIERYVENAEPVGSAALAGDERFRALCGSVSTATIRNDLADLEEAGLVMQPHTSAGRVPTDAGYRFYVNEMLRPRPLRSRERAQILAIPASPSSIEDALREATALLAQLTGYPAVATLPSAGRDTMRQVQIAPVPPHRLLLVLLTQSGRVENRLFEVGPGEVDARHMNRLNTVVNFLNEQLHGRTLSEVRSLGFESVSSGLHEEGTLALARLAWEQVRASVSDLGDERLVVQGVVTLLDEPEFSDIAHARSAMRLFDNGDALSDLLASHVDKKSARAIVIGREHMAGEGEARAEVPGVERLSFVGIAYGHCGEVLGAVGVMGPTRMKYAEAATLVPALAARLQTSLDSL